MGGARGRHQGDDLHARGRADGEGRRDPGLRREVVMAGDRATTRRSEAAQRQAAEGATFVHAFEDPAVDRGPGDARARAGRAARPSARGRRRPDRRRRARVRDRDRAQGAPARRAPRRRAGRSVRAARGRAGRRPDDRRRDRRQASGRADDGDPRRARSTTSSPSPTTRSRARSCSCSSGRSSWSRARAPSPSPRSLAGQDRGPGPACAVLSGGNIDATLLIEVARYEPHARRALPRRPHLGARPARRARACSSR